MDLAALLPHLAALLILRWGVGPTALEIGAASRAKEMRCHRGLRLLARKCTRRMGCLKQADLILLGKQDHTGSAPRRSPAATYRHRRISLARTGVDLPRAATAMGRKECTLMAEQGAGPGQPHAAKTLTRENLDALLDTSSLRQLALLYVMAKLDVADALRDGPKRSAMLARICAAHPDTLHRVLRALASLALLTEEADGSFALAPLGHLLRSDIHESLRGAVVLEWEIFVRAQDGLLRAVQTGESAFSQVFGCSLYEHLAQHPALARTFEAEMVGLSLSVSAALLAAYDFAPASRIVDVGGGVGALLAAILQAYPQATGIVFDLPAVATDAQAYLATAGLSARCDVVAGDFFDGLLHNWDDSHCVRILQNCCTAMAPDVRAHHRVGGGCRGR
jgi:hypothetical protein